MNMQNSSWIETLGLAWHIHIYGFGALFLLLTIISTSLAIYMLCTHSQRKYSAWAYYLALVCCMGLLGLSRVLGLLVDPYGAIGYAHPIINQINMNLASAFLASAIYMLLIVLVRMTKMSSMVSRGILGPYALIGIVILNVSVVVLTDVVTGIYQHLDYLRVICVSYFLLWGVCCCAFFVLINWRFYKLVFVNRKNLQRLQHSVSSNASSTKCTSILSKESNTQRNKPVPKSRMPLAMKVSIVNFVIFLFHLALLLYMLLCMTVYKYSERHHSEWAWWTRHTCNRLVELAFAAAILGMSGCAIRQ